MKPCSIAELNAMFELNRLPTLGREAGEVERALVTTG
jgi:hypothetical protein